jgi:predicted Zn-dependent peptidase
LGSAEAVAAITRADIAAYRDRWLRPDNATLFVVGDTTMAELKPALERALAGWRAPAVPKGRKAFATVTPPPSRIVLLDRPGSPQSVIMAGTALRSRGVDDLLALDMANDVLGGVGSSRLNTDLRETKGWAYNASSALQERREQASLILAAPVQTDRTADSLKAMIDNVRAYNGARPITQAELDRAVNNRVRSLPGGYETSLAVLDAMSSNAVLGRPDDYQEKLADASAASPSRRCGPHRPATSTRTP